mmetsp:Transcript_39662/g.90414  ORF Transcript_39662/g.90414 Transcript_39662/m.90414 type:complete len:256 (-) Transcript_39662:335-1102(-)
MKLDSSVSMSSPSGVCVSSITAPSNMNLTAARGRLLSAQYLAKIFAKVSVLWRRYFLETPFSSPPMCTSVFCAPLSAGCAAPAAGLSVISTSISDADVATCFSDDSSWVVSVVPEMSPSPDVPAARHSSCADAAARALSSIAFIVARVFVSRETDACLPDATQLSSSLLECASGTAAAFLAHAAARATARAFAPTGALAVALFRGTSSSCLCSTLCFFGMTALGGRPLVRLFTTAGTARSSSLSSLSSSFDSPSI